MKLYRGINKDSINIKTKWIMENLKTTGTATGERCNA